MKHLSSVILSNRHLHECLGIFVVVVAAYLLLRGTALFLVGAYNDDGVYVMLGKSLAEGNGYRLAYLIGNPVAVKYPPGLPALLAIPWVLGGTLAAVRTTVEILNPVACGIAAAVIWWIGRRDLALSPGPLAVAAIGPFLLDQAVQYYNIPIAEPYFLLGWAVAVALAATVSRIRGALALGLVLAATSLFRSAGLVLIPACLVALALRRLQWRVVLVAAAAATTPLIVWGVAHARLVALGPLSSSPDEVSYLSWIPFGSPQFSWYLVHVPWKNASAYLSELSGALAGPLIVGHSLVFGALVAAIVGSVLSWRKAPAIVLTVAPSVAVILLWPFAQDRLLLPVLPLIGLLAAVAIEKSVRNLPERFRLVLPIALVLTTLVVGFRQMELRRVAATSFVQGRTPKPRDSSIFFALAVNSRHIGVLSKWIRAYTTPQDRLLVDFPAGTYLYSGRETLSGSPAEPDYGPSVFRYPGRYLAERILHDSVTIVAIGIRGPLARDIETVSRVCPGVLRREIPYAEVYRVNRDDACLRSMPLR